MYSIVVRYISCPCTEQESVCVGEKSNTSWEVAEYFDTIMDMFLQSI